MRPSIFLFDIDGTLISAGGAGRRAVEGAFAARHGRPDACASFSFAGMTDRAIVRRALALIGEPISEAAIDQVIETYVSLLAGEVHEAADYQVHAGILAALDALERSSDVAVGLGTGNVEPGARIKLGRGGIDSRFGFGGYGSDAEDRAALLGIGADRGAARLGRPRGECRVVVIGDTPLDIAAAHAIGAEAIGVGTGPFTAEALLAVGADVAFADLAADGALAVLLGA